MASFKKIMAQLKYRAKNFSFRIKLRAKIAGKRIALAKWKHLQRADSKELAKTEKKLQGQLTRDERAGLAQRRRQLIMQTEMHGRTVEAAGKELALIRAQLRQAKEM